VACLLAKTADENEIVVCGLGHAWLEAMHRAESGSLSTPLQSEIHVYINQPAAGCAASGERRVTYRASSIIHDQDKDNNIQHAT
jgi:hypothetical protein